MATSTAPSRSAFARLAKYEARDWRHLVCYLASRGRTTNLHALEQIELAELHRAMNAIEPEGAF